MNYLIITVMGKELKFYPRANRSGYYFEMGNDYGFYTKDLFPVWGRPTKNNASEVAESYIKTHEWRIKTFNSYK